MRGRARGCVGTIVVDKEVVMKDRLLASEHALVAAYGVTAIANKVL
jgi:hypothetical protein